MQIKKDLLLHIESNHPNFKFAWAKSIFYNFRRTHEDGLYDCILFQRDGQAGGLAVEIATTYDPLWSGAGTGRLGRSTGLANLKFGKPNAIEVELNWYFYQNSKSQLHRVLTEISGDLQIHAMHFFAKSARDLRSDRLLKHGLESVRRRLPLSENDQLQLVTDLKAAQFMAHNVQNHLYEELRADLSEFAESNGISAQYIDWYAFGFLSILQERSKTGLP
jgi:hypothetical protein